MRPRPSRSAQKAATGSAGLLSGEVTNLGRVATPNRVRDVLVSRAERAILMKRGSADLRQLRRDLPAFPSPLDLERATADLSCAYEAYVSEVSTPGMAASLETSALLLALCRKVRVSSAMDLGSGFSSYVLRHWATEADCRVFSVDDEPAWLARTRQFLVANGLAPGQLCLWPQLPNQRFDLVFHDFANGTRREATMPRALQAARRFLVLDDAQHRGHRAAMAAACSDAGAHLYSLRTVTLDSMKRYAMLAMR